MTPTTRCIVLLSVCSLWGACVEKESAAQKPNAHTMPPAALVAAAKVPEVQFKPDIVETLAATAPLPVKTIADTRLSPTDPIAPAKNDTALIDDHSDSVDFERSLAASEVVVDRFVLATDVKGREPVGETDTFSTDTKKIYAFVQLANKGEPYAVMVHWEPLDGPATPYGVKLEVPTAERYRTWSWTAIQRKPGRYRAILRTLDGEEIASRELLITDGVDD